MEWSLEITSTFKGTLGIVFSRGLCIININKLPITMSLLVPVISISIADLTTNVFQYQEKLLTELKCLIIKEKAC